MIQPTDSGIDDKTEEAEVIDDSPRLPFETDAARSDRVMSSLQDRPELVDKARQLIEQAPTAPRPVVKPRPDFPAPEEATPILVVQTPGGTMETRHAMETPRYLIGRRDCDLELDDPFVSRWHVQLFRREEALVLQDMASDNGVYLRIADDLVLEDGDQIVIGRQRLVFRTELDDSSEDKVDQSPRSLGAPSGGSTVRLVRYLEGGEVAGVYGLNEETTIGGSEADLTFGDDPFLSATHAVIARHEDRYVLRDADSDTGTFIRIEDSVELVEGDCFLLGRTRIRLTFA